MNKPHSIDGEYRIKSEYAKYYTRTQNSYIFEAGTVAYSDISLHFIPIRTIATGKTPTWKQQTRHMTVADPKHFVRVD